ELASLYAARTSFDLPGSRRPIDTEERIALIREQANLRFGVFALWSEPDDYRAHRRVSRLLPMIKGGRGLQGRVMYSTLALIAGGLLPLDAAIPPSVAEA